MKKIKALIISILAVIICLPLAGCFNPEDPQDPQDPVPVEITAEEFVEFYTNENLTNTYNKYKIEVEGGIEGLIEIIGTTVQAKINVDFEDVDYEIYLFNNKCFVKKTSSTIDTFVFNFNFLNPTQYSYTESRVREVFNIVAPLTELTNAYEIVANELNIGVPAPNANNKFYKTEDDSKMEYDINLDYTISSNGETSRYIVDLELTYSSNKLTKLEYEKLITESQGNSVSTSSVEFTYEPYNANILIPSLDYPQAY